MDGKFSHIKRVEFVDQNPIGKSTRSNGERTGEALDDLNPASRELLTDAKVEPALADAAPGEVVQFERLGYFAADPDSPMLFHRTVTLRDEWAAIRKRRSA